ncbi:MAG: hypothetical protein ACI9XU_001735 [Arenicella sp.]|jgi:hypothetical protein
MEIVVGLTLFLVAYLNIVAIVIIFFSETLSRFQKLIQIIVTLFLPLIGALIVMHMLYDEAQLNIKWVPWPFKNIVLGKEIKRREDESGEGGLF